MTIAEDNIFSWSVALWLLIGNAFVVVAWRLTRHMKVMWQRALLRSSVMAFFFTPIPGPEMFLYPGTHWEIIPFWSLLFEAVASGEMSASAAAVVLVPWALMTYVLWVAGMSIHHLFCRGGPANK